VVARVPVARQPLDVRQQHRIDRSHPAKGPSCEFAGPCGGCERLRVVRLDPFIRADVHHQATAVIEPGEEVRDVPATASPTGPEQPERLAHQSRHLRIEIHQHRVVPFQMRLAGQLPGRRGRPVVTGHGLLPLVGLDRTHRRQPLEPHRPAGRQGLASAYEILIDIRDLECRLLQALDAHTLALPLEPARWCRSEKATRTTWPPSETVSNRS
jgi:hypothetical protein